MQITELFEQLVKIDSPSGEEKNMQTYIKKWLDKNNFEYKEDESGNILAHNKLPGESIMFACHLDTVEPGRGISPQIIDGIIKSDGDTILAADNKAWVAAILDSLEKTSHSRPIEILFSVREELDFGVTALPISWIKSKICFILDFAQPIGGIVLSAPYMDNFLIKMKGKSSHVSKINESKNVLIPAIEAMNNLKIGQVDENTTINIGTIKGGEGGNVVPENLEIFGEVRSFSKDGYIKGVEEVKKIFEEASKKYDVNISIDISGGCPGYNHSESDEEIVKLKEIYKNLNISVTIHKSFSASDGNILNDKGLKTIVMSDGVKFPHSTDEQISVEDLVKLSDIITEIIKTY